MWDYFLSVVFGVVEGLTEFLPVSSTAHIRIAEAICGVKLDDPYWKMYSIVIQLGAILSVIVFFRGRIMEFMRSFPGGQSDSDNGAQPPATLLTGILTHPLTLVMIAFVVTAGPAYMLKKKGIIDKNLENLWMIGASLLVGGIIMWGVDVLFTRPRTTDMKQMGVPGVLQAIWIGAAQILSAVFPGTSRSMSTIAAGQMASMSRAAALEFSFFLSIPIMLAATGKELLDTVRGHSTAGPITMDAHQWGVLAVGFVVSFFVAWAVVAWFIHWVRKHGFAPFAVYRIILGVGILIWARVG